MKWHGVFGRNPASVPFSAKAGGRGFMSFAMIMQLIISGIALGFIYSMVSIEYTLIFNSTGLLNFSHDKLIMIGAYAFA